MSFDSTKNFSISTLASGIDDNDDSLTIQTDDGLKFPDPPFNCVIWNKGSYSEPQDDPNLEIVRVTAKSTDTFTILRAQEGTTAHSHAAGDRVELNITAKVIQDLIDNKTDKTTTEQTIYVNSTNGSDTTGDGSSSNPYATIQKAINVLPEIIKHNITIAVSGNHTISTTINFSGHMCLASLTIKAMDLSGNNLYDNGTATSASSTTLQDTSKSWTTDFWQNGYVFIYQGTGAGQVRQISSNTSNTLTVPTWDATPDTSSKYVIVMISITGSGVDKILQNNKINGLNIYGFRWTNSNSYNLDFSEVLLQDVKYNLIDNSNGGITIRNLSTGGCYYNLITNIASGKSGTDLNSGSIWYVRANCFKSSSSGVGTGLYVWNDGIASMQGSANACTFINLQYGIRALLNSMVYNGSANTFVSCSTNYTPSGNPDYTYIS